MQNIKNDTYYSYTSHKAKKNAERWDATNTTTTHICGSSHNPAAGGSTKKIKNHTAPWQHKTTLQHCVAQNSPPALLYQKKPFVKIAKNQNFLQMKIAPSHAMATPPPS